jgi:hypothetical protein
MLGLGFYTVCHKVIFLNMDCQCFSNIFIETTCFWQNKYIINLLKVGRCYRILVRWYPGYPHDRTKTLQPTKTKTR